MNDAERSSSLHPADDREVSTVDAQTYRTGTDHMTQEQADDHVGETYLDEARQHHVPATPQSEVVFDLRDLSVLYGDFRAVRGATLKIHEQEITAFIGPSGCGKTTVLRCLNRMNDFIETAKVEGTVRFHGVDLYDPAVNATEVRRRIGMVFQKPNPFPKSIYDNVAYGPRLAGVRKRSELDDIVEQSLRGAALWDEVKDRLKASGLGLSGGQQQRLCIARAVAVEPDVILMDEPCSALDPMGGHRLVARRPVVVGHDRPPLSRTGRRRSPRSAARVGS